MKGEMQRLLFLQVHQTIMCYGATRSSEQRGIVTVAKADFSSISIDILHT
jgi:hypothetical protein